MNNDTLKSWWNRLFGSACMAGVAWSIGAALNIPVWRDFEFVDRFDIAALTFFGVMALTAPVVFGMRREP